MRLRLALGWSGSLPRARLPLAWPDHGANHAFGCRNDDAPCLLNTGTGLGHPVSHPSTVFETNRTIVAVQAHPENSNMAAPIPSENPKG
jgi:hypothetical protein